MVSHLSSVGMSAIPTGIPLPSAHPWIRLGGLQSWFRSLGRDESHVFHHFLLNFDTDQQSPTAALYLKPVKTSSVIAVYDMARPESRVSFNNCVEWEGTPDQKPFPDVPPGSLGLDRLFVDPGIWAESTPVVKEGPSQPAGYDCYKILFRESAWDSTVSRLGQNPWAPAVACALLSEPGVWAEGRFLLTFGSAAGPSPSGSPAFVQAHVERSSKGMTVRQLLPHLAGSVRVGATDLAAALSIAEQSEAPAAKQVFDIRPKGASHKMEFAVYGILGADTKKYPSIAFTPLTSPVLAVMLGVYESVRLDSAKFVITVDEGSGNTVWCAMVAAGTNLGSVDDWYSAPVMSQVSGSDTGVVRGKFEMPAVTMFSREYRAATLGNPPAKFVFAYTGAAETNASIRGVFSVTVSGQRLMTSVNIGGGRGMGPVSSVVASVHSALGYDVRGGDSPPYHSAGGVIAASADDDAD